MRDRGRAANKGVLKDRTWDRPCSARRAREAHERRRSEGPAGSSPLRGAPRGSVVTGFDCQGPERASRHGLRHLPQGPHQGQPRPSRLRAAPGRTRTAPLPLPGARGSGSRPRPGPGPGPGPGPRSPSRPGPALFSSPGLASVLLHLAQPHHLPTPRAIGCGGPAPANGSGGRDEARGRDGSARVYALAPPRR